MIDNKTKTIWLVAVLIIAVMVLSQTAVFAENQENTAEDLALKNLYRTEYGIGFKGPASIRDGLVWDLLELDFIMEVMEKEDIFRIQPNDIHQFRGLSNKALFELRQMIRNYLNE